MIRVGTICISNESITFEGDVDDNKVVEGGDLTHEEFLHRTKGPRLRVKLGVCSSKERDVDSKRYPFFTPASSSNLVQ